MILAVYLRGKQSVGIRAIHVLSFIIQCGDDERITKMGWVPCKYLLLPILSISFFQNYNTLHFAKINCRSCQAYFKIYIADYYALTN